MHASVMAFLKKHIYSLDINGKSVLEIGSQNINGSPRSVIQPLDPASYIGVDFAAGDGVDMVADATDLISVFGRDRFDVVVSTEMLEHAKDWRAAVRSMKGVLKPLGLLIVTTRGPGFPYHGFPYDYWRFTGSDFTAIFSDLLFMAYAPDPEFPGVMLKARKPLPFQENDLSKVEVQPAPAP